MDETGIRTTQFQHHKEKNQMTRAEEFKARAQQYLIDQTMSVEEAWTRHLPDSHKIIENEQSVAIGTKGARAHASDGDILEMAARLMAGDWGEVEYEEDRGQNEYHLWHERGIIFGIYRAGDGTKLWATQSHRLVPPTVMLPEER